MDQTPPFEALHELQVIDTTVVAEYIDEDSWRRLFHIRGRLR